MALALASLTFAMVAAGLRLDWQAAGECPDAAAVRAKVEALVGAEALATTDLHVQARVEHKSDYTLHLTLVRAESRDTRTLRDPQCGAVAEAAALVIAVAIDPAVLGRSPVTPPPEVPEPTPAEPVPVEPTPVEPTPSPPPPPTDDETALEAVPGANKPIINDSATKPRLGLGLRLGGGVGFARVLPRAHAVFDLGLGLEGRGWRAEVSGVFVAPVATTVASEPVIGGVFRVVAAEFRGCGVPRVRAVPLSFPVCAGLQVGAMHGRGTGEGLSVSQVARSVWLATRWGAALRWHPRAGRVGLWLGADLVVLGLRPNFVTAGGVQVHHAARVGGQAGLGLEVRLR